MPHQTKQTGVFMNQYIYTVTINNNIPIFHVFMKSNNSFTQQKVNKIITSYSNPINKKNMQLKRNEEINLCVKMTRGGRRSDGETAWEDERNGGRSRV